MRTEPSRAPAPADRDAVRREADQSRRARRVKALVRLEPVLDMVGAAARGFFDLPHYDVRALAEVAITTVVDHMGISTDDGAPRAAVVQAVETAARQMHPDHTQAARRLADWTVDWLLNAEDGGRARRMRYSDPSDAYAEHELDVTVLHETRGADGDELVIKATAEAINTMLVAFDHDLADAQIAAEAVLTAHIESGKLDRASASARKAADASRGYTTSLRQILERTRRDVTAVDWSDSVPRLLDEAHAHLLARRAAEERLRASAEDTRDQQSDPARRATAADIVALVSECLHRHDALLGDLIAARRVFLDEQRRQQLAVTAVREAVAVGAELLAPLLAATIKDALDPLERFTEGALGPVVPRRHSLAMVVDQLLAPRRDRDNAPAEPNAPADALQLLADNVTFDADDRRAAAELLDDLDGQARLSQLLAGARTAGVSDDLVAVLVSAAFAFDADPRHAVTVDGVPLDDPRYGGDDLLVTAKHQTTEDRP